MYTQPYLQTKNIYKLHKIIFYLGKRRNQILLIQ